MDTGDNAKPTPPADENKLQINIGEVNIINVGDIVVEIAPATEKDEAELTKAKGDEILSKGKTKDGALQCDVFRCDENSTYIETLAYIDYNLYRVLDDGQMVHLR